MKLSPLQVPTGWSVDRGSARRDTGAAIPTHDRGTVSARAALAAIVHELLGGEPGAWSHLGGYPLAALHESAGRVLRDALCNDGYGDVIEFWQTLVLEVEKRALFQPRVVTEETIRAGVTVKAQGRVKRGTLLRLRPMNKAVLPVHISARPTLRIGRGSSLADVLTRFLPETAANARLTDRLGRVHVLGRRVNGWPCFWDGDGRRRSVNGTWLDGERLDDQAGMRCARESDLRLGRQYHLRVTCLDEDPVALETDVDKNDDKSAHGGCTVIVAAHEQTPTRLVAWLGKSVGLLIASHGLAWSHFGAAGSDAAVLHADGGFWLANLASPPGSIRIDGVAAGSEVAMALRDGQRVECGTAHYVVRVDV